MLRGIYVLIPGRIYRPLPDDGASDIAAYNKELEARGNPTWIHANWLYAECYLCEFWDLSYVRVYNRGAETDSLL